MEKKLNETERQKLMEKKKAEKDKRNRLTKSEIIAKAMHKQPNATKIPRWTAELKKVIKDNPASFALTLKELCAKVNHGLRKEERITYQYLILLQSPDSKRYAGDMTWITDEQKEDFLDTIEIASVNAKLTLVDKMLDDDNQNKWGTAWILERKFSDLKLKQDIQIGQGGITLSIEGGSAVQDSLNLIEEIDFEDVTDQKKIG